MDNLTIAGVEPALANSGLGGVSVVANAGDVGALCAAYGCQVKFAAALAGLQLMEIYYRSVGNNGALLLNVPPDNRGLIHENDVNRLMEFKAERDRIFKTNFAKYAEVQADSVFSASHNPAMAIDGDRDTYWVAETGKVKAIMSINLGQPRLQFRTFYAIRPA